MKTYISVMEMRSFSGVKAARVHSWPLTFI